MAVRVSISQSSVNQFGVVPNPSFPRTSHPDIFFRLGHTGAARPLNVHWTIEKLTVFIYDEQRQGHPHPHPCPHTVVTCVPRMQSALNPENFFNWRGNCEWN